MISKSQNNGRCLCFRVHGVCVLVASSEVAYLQCEGKRGDNDEDGKKKKKKKKKKKRTRRRKIDAGSIFIPFYVVVFMPLRKVQAKHGDFYGFTARDDYPTLCLYSMSGLRLSTSIKHPSTLALQSHNAKPAVRPNGGTRTQRENAENTAEDAYPASQRQPTPDDEPSAVSSIEQRAQDSSAMAEFNGRRAPNFSQYLNELNTLPSPFEQTAQPEDLGFDVDAELALFTNAEFLDFDPAGNVGGIDEQQPVSSGTVSPANGRQDMNYVGILNDIPMMASGSCLLDMFPVNADFNLSNFPYFQPQQPTAPVQSTTYPSAQPLPANTSLPQSTPIYQPQQQQQQQQPQQQHQHLPSQPQLQTPPQPAVTQSQPATVSSKRKSDATTTSEADRLAQEEDKRRRNTAASARFRIKKKEREKNLEKTVKDVTSKNSALESRVSQLEMENRWLRNLIVEKNGSAISEGDLSGMFHKYQEATGQHQNQKQASTASPSSELKSSP
ncbi:bZIP transcription factor, putative [Trichophyton verrucosum HKI 0517]|uniref:BZIP transcription factor, putative n=1 Tax=Trichophyton verrucosum (strain HKI 0517) TaxID=663202 RepID=D4CYZ1_TRIVH|nr:bZIP transcription factor, putative [Trichophyton verrucosum HKI 0517]EFE45155.1 bZIP transcription factor, putative [Trichophyton verrucosum HKI 0517]